MNIGISRSLTITLCLKVLDIVEQRDSLLFCAQSSHHESDGLNALRLL